MATMGKEGEIEEEWKMREGKREKGLLGQWSGLGKW